MRSEGAR